MQTLITVTQNAQTILAFILAHNANNAYFDDAIESCEDYCANNNDVYLLSNEDDQYIIFADKNNDEIVQTIIINNDNMYVNYDCVLDSFDDVQNFPVALLHLLKPEYASEV